MMKIINYRTLFLLFVMFVGDLCAMDVDDSEPPKKKRRIEERDNVPQLPHEIQRYIFFFLAENKPFDSAISSIRRALLTSKIWQEDIFLVDYLIAQLVYRYNVRLNNVLDALGDEIIDNWLAVFKVLQENIGEGTLKIGEDILPFAGYYLFSEENKLALVRMLLSTKNILFTANMVDAFGRTPLIYAAMQGDVDLTDRFIQRGADLDHRDQNSASALMYAVMNGNVNLADLLIQRDANLDYRDQHGASAWLYAKLFHYVAIAMLLENAEQEREDSNFADNIAKWNEFLESFAQLVFRNDEDTKQDFMANAQQNDFSLIQFITDMHNLRQAALIRGAALDGNLYTLLAAEHAGIEINRDFNEGPGFTTLMYAALGGNVNTILFLLSRGAVIDAVNMDNLTSLMYAVSRKRHAAIMNLVRLGANVNHRSNAGKTPLMFASEGGDISIVQFLVKNGANVNDTNNQGLTAVTFAILGGNASIMRYLVEQGGTADLSVLNMDGLNDEQKRVVRSYELEMDYKSLKE